MLGSAALASQAAQMDGRAKGKLAKPPGSASLDFSLAALLFAGQLLHGDFAGVAVLVGVLNLGP